MDWLRWRAALRLAWTLQKRGKAGAASAIRRVSREEFEAVGGGLVVFEDQGTQSGERPAPGEEQWVGEVGVLSGAQGAVEVDAGQGEKGDQGLFRRLWVDEKASVASKAMVRLTRGWRSCWISSRAMLRGVSWL